MRRAAAAAGGPVDVLELPTGHVDICTGDAFERSVRAQVDLLTRTPAPVPAPST